MKTPALEIFAGKKACFKEYLSFKSISQKYNFMCTFENDNYYRDCVSWHGRQLIYMRRLKVKKNQNLINIHTHT